MTDLADRPAPEQAPVAPTGQRHDLAFTRAVPAAPTQRRSRLREAATVVGQGLTLFALLVVAFLGHLYVVSSLEHDRDQRGLRERFRGDLDLGQAWIGGAIPEGEPVAILEVEELGLREVVVEGTSSTVLRRGPGHLRAAPLPGQPGNAVIAGRRVAYGGPFRHLDDLVEGDEITVTTGQGEARYVVTGVAQVRADDPDVVDDFGDDRLTLISSAPELRATRRLVATAELQGEAEPAPAARPLDLRTDELGLHGDRSQAFSLLLWAATLLAAALATAWLRRSWSRRSTWLLCVPVLALLVLLVFDSFTPVLPSTL